MVDESTKQKLCCAILRGQLSARLTRTADMLEDDIASLSLGELINTLFLVHGHFGSLGNYSVTFGATVKLVGRELMWQEPEAKPTASEAEQRVN
jgi:hypothetical protein